ncbi:MAG: hypothetical protein H0T41_14155 [Rhodobacteraceae bacterium]|nr:hypothetical protein [Paracoccaceae bacterium]
MGDLHAGDAREGRLDVLVGDDERAQEAPRVPAHVVSTLGPPVRPPPALVLLKAFAVAEASFAERAGDEAEMHLRGISRDSRHL